MLAFVKPLRNLENALFASGGNRSFAEPGGRRLGLGERSQAAARRRSGRGGSPLDRVAFAVDGAEFEPRRRPGDVARQPERSAGADAGQRRRGERCRRRRSLRHRAKSRRSGAPIWRSCTGATEIGPTPSPPIIGASAISTPGSRRGGRPRGGGGCRRLSGSRSARQRDMCRPLWRGRRGQAAGAACRLRRSRRLGIRRRRSADTCSAAGPAPFTLISTRRCGWPCSMRGPLSRVPRPSQRYVAQRPSNSAKPQRQVPHQQQQRDIGQDRRRQRQLLIG